jgi:hypothetical protein
VIEVEYEFPVGCFPLPLLFKLVFCAGWKFRRLPRLALVFSEVLDNEGPDAGNTEESFTGGMNGEAPEVARNPPTIELF